MYGAVAGSPLAAQAHERDELKSSPNRPYASEKREGSVQAWNCPTQAKIGLEWAARRVVFLPPFPISSLGDRTFTFLIAAFLAGSH